ncbi:SPOR domain-containing protein [Metabacillus litoralis]|uniref:SPOR domain-containing protein n=1 Tax=Metabacillus litoralis TaxID=152268 RepID=UPI002041DE90|nr:SPOR domain-containing protein [Metabacillus litoralis]MCM3162958.1 SPOR domain-containing protein [Metabacillus litoralis]
MDKQTSDTVKIKINGKDRPVSDKEPKTEEYQISSWEEKLQAEKEIASAKKEEEDFPWLLPEDDDTIFEDDPKVVTPKKKKILSNSTVTPFVYSKKTKSKSNFVTFPLKQMFTVILMAIFLGVGFGYIALNFLSNKDMPDASVPTVVTNDTPDTASTEGGDTEEPAAASTSTETLQLYAVQGGIFSTKEGADTVSSNIKNKGFASTVIEADGSFTVLAGIGKEKAETEALNNLYKQNSFNDFWGGKQLSLSIATTKSADQWVSSIVTLSSLASQATNGQSVNQEDIVAVESQIKEIKTANETEKSLLSKLSEAAANVKGNKGWEAQQAILEVVASLQS